MCLFEYLVTTYRKTNDEILSILKASNIKGKILVGNQCDVDETISFKTDTQDITIFHQKSIGVSKNRNFLLRKATSKFVTFVDDDQIYFDVQDRIEKEAIANDLPAFRVNVVSDNQARRIRTFKKGKLSIRQVGGIGVWGIFFKREKLLEHKLFFDENIGPGQKLNHGEDSIYLLECKKHFNIVQFDMLGFHLLTEESMWVNEQRDLNIEMFSHGYLYFRMYGWMAKFFAIMFVFTHMDCYPKGTKKCFLIKKMYEGINFGRKSLK